MLTRRAFARLLAAAVPVAFASSRATAGTHPYILTIATETAEADESPYPPGDIGRLAFYNTLRITLSDGRPDLRYAFDYWPDFNSIYAPDPARTFAREAALRRAVRRAARILDGREQAPALPDTARLDAWTGAWVSPSRGE